MKNQDTVAGGSVQFPLKNSRPSKANYNQNSLNLMKKFTKKYFDIFDQLNLETSFLRTNFPGHTFSTDEQKKYFFLRTNKDKLFLQPIKYKLFLWTNKNTLFLRTNKPVPPITIQIRFLGHTHTKSHFLGSTLPKKLLTDQRSLFSFRCCFSSTLTIQLQI